MKYAIWVGMALVTLMMLMGGVMKLMGNPMATGSFATLGLPAIFATFIGLCEIAGGIGIWFRRTSMYAAAGIAIIMIGAVYFHVVHTPISEGIPAIIILAICGFIVSRRGTGIIG
jgi:putative oxidoreductase